MWQIFDADTGEAPVVKSESSDTSHAPAKEAAPRKQATECRLARRSTLSPISIPLSRARQNSRIKCWSPNNCLCWRPVYYCEGAYPNSESEVPKQPHPYLMAPPIELDTTAIVASAAQTTDTSESQTLPDFAKNTVVFGISGVVCLVGMFGLVVVSLRRRGDLRSTTVVTSDHWADPNFGPGDRNLVANISVL
jgi:hypothetical protein